ncbi:cubilin-like [Sitophilus oryzae]|uniref:Cubilin-like n=1 Tax=Sitophilus oryzae TaxID=7048 RepID=A0A6J2XC60_SITOR|nr:cubilin-like [Sitophilus oryzae]
MHIFHRYLVIFINVYTASVIADVNIKERPRLYTINGNLHIDVPESKNIKFGSSSFLVNEIDVLPIIQKADNATKFIDMYGSLVSGYQTQLDDVNSKISLLMSGSSGGINNRSKSLDLASLDLKITRIRRALTALRRSFNNLQTSLYKDECSSNPCKHGGTCLDLYKNFFCQCPDGWEGTTCEQDTNECFRFVGTDLGCQNGGTCENLPGSYRCLCQNGWIGIHCNRKPTDCNSGGSEICGHGTCIPQNNDVGYKCLCDAGWTTDGVHKACNMDVDECKSNHPPCSTNPLVLCTNVPGSFMCQHCPPGYTGNGYYCADINECEILNGGCSISPYVECINTPGSSKCSICPPGYLGDGRICTYKGLCNVNNGGCHVLARCIDNAGTMGTPVQCLCPPGYLGSGIGVRGCTKNGNPCSPNPCAHGNCAPNNSSIGFQCVCENKYFGTYCDQYDNPCASSPCLHGGSCQNQGSSYVCKCIAGFSGNQCQKEQPVCGGNVNARNGTIKFPPENYVSLGAISCAWTIRTLDTLTLKINFVKFNLHDSCDVDWVQIHDGRNTLAPAFGRFCGKNLPLNGTITTTQNTVYMWLRSSNKGNTPQFELTWNSLLPVCVDMITVGSGMITSPGYPAPYPNNRLCVWSFSIPVDKRLLFHVYSLDIGSDSDCSGDYLEFQSFPVLGRRYNTFKKLCNSTIPEPFHSVSATGHIIFKSNAKNQHSGFQIGYSLVDGIPGCGGVYTSRDGYIKSIEMSDSMPSVLTCTYQIKFPLNVVITVDILEMNIEKIPTGRNSLAFYQGTSKEDLLIGKYFGTTLPGPITSVGNSLLIVSQSVNKFQHNWKLKYKAECLLKFTDPKKDIQSSNYYTGWDECTYVIEQPQNNIIILNLELYKSLISLPDSCIPNYVEVRDGDNSNSTLLGRFCKESKIKLESTTNYLWIKIKSKIAYFSANYTTINTGCGGLLKEDRQSISYPPRDTEKYLANSNCRWVIVAPPGKIIQLTWLTFSVEQSFNCTYDYVKIFDNNTDDGMGGLIGKYCGSKLPPTLLSTSNIMTVDFVADTSINAEGFLLSYAFLKEDNICEGNYYTPSGYIRSPGYPKGYPVNKECVWTITAPPGSQIMLNVSSFHLEFYPKCKYDYLEIRNGGSSASPLIGTYCGTEIPKVIYSHTNKLYLKFKSDMSKSEPGFLIRWSSAATGCGGMLTGPSGSIISPHYPEPYAKNSECLWKILISLGSKIQIYFADFNLEEHSKCSIDYVELLDGGDINSKSLGRFCTPQIKPVVSSGNRMLVKFRSDISYEGRGFHLQYSTVCTNTVTGFSGVIESPNFPNEYPTNQNCEWNIIVPSNNKINITFSHFSVEQRSTACEFDYVEVQYKVSEYNGGDNTFQTYGKYCGGANPGLIPLNSDHAKIRFVTDDLLVSNGFRLEWQINGCGGILTEDRGVLKTPNYPKPYPPSITCNWIISVPAGNSITLAIYTLDVERDDSCSFDYLKVFDGRDETGNLITTLCRIKDSSTIRVDGNSNEMLVSFVADYNYQGKGLYAAYHTNQAECGGTLRLASGYIYSPNYPNNYNESNSCEWLLSADEHHRLGLTFEDLDLPDDCNKTYIKVFDGPNQAYPLLETICGSSNITGKIISSTYDLLFVEFHNNNKLTSKGFKAHYYTACGATIKTSSSGVLDLVSEYDFHNTNPEEDLACSFTIQSTVLSGHVSLTISRLSYAGGINWCNPDEGAFIVYNGLSSDSPRQGIYCIDKLPPTIVSDGSALHIVFKQKVDIYATYSIIDSECGGKISALNGFVASPGWPNNYASNASCDWTISIGPGNVISLNFLNFDIPESEYCNSDYLEIREESETGKLIGVYCGNTVPANITSTSGTMSLVFKSTTLGDGISSIKKGFYFEYSFSYNNELSGPSGKIGNPLYPSSFNSYEKFTWLINTKPTTRIEINFEEFSFDYDEQCSGGLKFYDGINEEAILIKNLCGYDLPPTLLSTSNVILVVASHLSSRVASKFLLRWKELPTSLKLKTLNATDCQYIHRMENETNVTISSPGYPNKLPTNLNCEWVFETDQTSHFKVVFLDINLITFTRRTCMYSSTIKLLEKSPLTGNFELLKEICDNTQTEHTFYPTSVMKITFKTLTYTVGKGFQAQIFKVCGGYITQPSGYIIFDKDHIQDTECQWNITVRSGRTIKLTFLSFDLNNIDFKCINNLIIRNGKFADSPFLDKGKFCNSTVPYTLNSSSNHLYLKYWGSPDIKGFKIKYEEVSFKCGGEISLSSMDNFTEITSPRYPNIPYPHSECVWVITGVPGETLRIDFEDRFDLTQSDGCNTEYVELRDGGTEWSKLLNRYCITTPDTIFTTGNVLYIKFFTDTDEPRNGFKLKVSLGRCGGILEGYSTLDSKTIPGTVELNKNCTWHVRSYGDSYFEVRFRNMHLNGTLRFYEKTIGSQISDLGTFSGYKTPNDSIKSTTNEIILDYTPRHSDDEFYISFFVRRDRCFKRLNDESGTIISPEYPSSKPATFLCIWRIKVPQGRRITFNVKDVDIDRSMVILSNGWASSMPITENIQPDATYESSDNTASVLYWKKVLTPQRGIKLTYTSDKPTICQGSYNQTEGTIISPNASSFLCEWSRDIKEPNTTVAVQVHLETNQTKHSENINQGGVIVYINRRTVHLDRDTVAYVIRFPSSDSSIEARRYLNTFNKFIIKYKTYPCGGLISEDEGTISSPNFPNSPNTSLECAWNLEINYDYRVKITVNSLDLGDDCDSSFLTIYNGNRLESPRIGKFCRNNKPSVLITETNEVFIEYRYTQGQASNSKGFSLFYEPYITSCGGIFHKRDTIIRTPNYKDDYPNNMECIWEINAPDGNIIALEFISRFYVEESKNCTKDYVEVFDWDGENWVSKQKLCGRKIPEEIKASGNRMQVIFRSDANVTAIGFEAMIKWHCGGDLIATETKKYLTSPDYPNLYERNLTCIYTIKPKVKNKVINIQFLDFDLREGTPICSYDNLTIYTVKKPNIRQTLCGKTLPKSQRLDRDAVITFKTEHYAWNNGKGFKLSYVLESCGGNITEPIAIKLPTQNTEESNYFLSYQPRQICSWYITAPPDQLPVFEIHELTLQGAYCYMYYLIIYDGLQKVPSKRLRQLCQSAEESITLGMSKTMLVNLDVSAEIFKGLKAEIYFIYGPSVGCGGVVYLNDTQTSSTITPPNNLPDLDCHWKIIAPIDYKIKIEFSNININSYCNSTRRNYTYFCTCSFIEVKDGGGPQADLLSKLCSSDNGGTRTFTTSWNTGYVRLFSASPQKNAFSLTVTSFVSQCGPSILVPKSTPQVLTSPGYPVSYPGNIACIWIIKNTLMGKILLHFEEFDLAEGDGQDSNCYGDRFEISDDPNKSIIMEGYGLNSRIPQSRVTSIYRKLYNTHVFCGKNEKPFDYYSAGNNLTLSFRSDEISKKGKGFKLTYSNEGCNRTIEANEGRIKNQYVYENCYITITSDANTTLSLYFMVIYISPSANCSQSNIEVRENNERGSLLLRHCGFSLPNPVFSNSNKLYIAVKGAHKQLNQRLARPLLYNYDFIYLASQDGIGCGGKMYNYMGKFSSPMYPNLYRKESLCTWNVKVPIGHKVALKFSVFDITDTCAKSKVVVATYKNNQVTEHTFCQNDTPAVLFSDHTINVTYYSSVNNGGTGWMAYFQAVKKETSSLLWYNF